MQSTAKPTTADDPCDFVVVPSDQIGVAPSDAEITDLLRAAARRSETGAGAATDPSRSAGVPAVDATFRATDVRGGIARSRRSSFGWQAIRVLTALVLAVGIGVGWQLFGYAAKETAGKWLPHLASLMSLPLDKLPLDKLGLSAPSQPAESTATEETPAQPASATPDASDSAAASTTAPPADSSQQLLQSMARDLANANQEIETLKASIAELKASQQQMIRERAAEQAAKSRLATTPPHPPAAHKPAPAYAPTPTPLGPPPAQAARPTPSYAPTQAVVAPPPTATQPYAPRQVDPSPPIPLQPQAQQPGLAAVPRPPMPITQ